MGPSSWGGGNSIGSIYRINEFDLNRIGGWMHGRILVGDIALCYRHSGDCFYDYYLLEYGENFAKLNMAGKFGAYAIGEELDWKPTTREFHLLMAGEILKGENYRKLLGIVSKWDQTTVTEDN